MCIKRKNIYAGQKKKVKVNKSKTNKNDLGEITMKSCMNHGFVDVRNEGSGHLISD